MDTELNNKIKNYSLLPWVEKYRPHEIKDILCHSKIINVLQNYLNQNKLPHLVFYGPPGTGKTSTIIAFAKNFYGDNFDNMTLILNASEERGIETIRNRVKQFVITKSNNLNDVQNLFKLVILDEIDSMTADAQSILRKIIETYTLNVRFCFICNYIKKINIAIQSRCVIFKFKPITFDIMHSFINKISDLENMKITENAINLIIKMSYGDMRKLLNILQSLNMTVNNISDSDMENKQITQNTVSKTLTCATDKMTEKLLNYIQTHSLLETHNYIYNLFINAEISLIEIIHIVYDVCMDYIINDNTTILKYPLNKVINIIKNIAIIDKNLTSCNDENIQIMSFTALFFL
jgi:replication factor C subunit 3/5